MYVNKINCNDHITLLRRPKDRGSVEKEAGGKYEREWTRKPVQDKTFPGKQSAIDDCIVDLLPVPVYVAFWSCMAAPCGRPGDWEMTIRNA